MSMDSPAKDRLAFPRMMRQSDLSGVSQMDASTGHNPEMRGIKLKPQRQRKTTDSSEATTMKSNLT